MREPGQAADTCLACGKTYSGGAGAAQAVVNAQHTNGEASWCCCASVTGTFSALVSYAGCVQGADRGSSDLDDTDMAQYRAEELRQTQQRARGLAQAGGKAEVALSYLWTV